MKASGGIRQSVQGARQLSVTYSALAGKIAAQGEMHQSTYPPRKTEMRICPEAAEKYKASEYNKKDEKKIGPHSCGHDHDSSTKTRCR